ncbi:MAG: hypothetical protein KKH93_02950 [Candidatus Omnitrophica bacterium]|nr:hypothetical protein [Candidatus Omnitrophota bacterium]MBU2044688.1 hypothetical protein [Candidatus Omnitrophota bacterium]MBU2265422.1 hypothetical protein [Candidatus Omnitrophota bacterium]MBU2474250.1 hypothetical protein [Candidatus Omnitrophota bacterium]
MKSVLIGLLLGLLILPCVYAETGDSSAQSAVAPLLLPVAPQNSTSCAATRYPDFYSWEPGNAACGRYVDDHYSLRRRAPLGTPDAGYFGYYVDLDASGNEVFTRIPGDGEYVSMSGLSTAINFEILGLSQYKKTAKITINWTVRIEGSVHPEELWRKHDPWYCPGWTGKSYQRFPEGNAYTRLFVEGVARGSLATMTVPSAGEAVTGFKAVDPNITGSVVLTPDMFNGEFPEELNVEVKWYNDTAMDLTAYDRNLIITIIPTL